MRNKKLFNLSATILGIITLFSFNNVQATEGVFSGINLTREDMQAYNTRTFSNSITLQIKDERESENIYTWNPNTVGEARKVWKIAEIDSSNIRNYSNLYYCLNAEIGFEDENNPMANGARDNYTDYLDMKDIMNKNNIINYSKGNLGTNYNKVLWILENSYIPGVSTSIDKENLLKKAALHRDQTRNFSEYLSDTLIDTDADINLTEEQIEVIQQLAIWHFTNGYNVTANMLYENGRQINGLGNNYDVGNLGVDFVNEGKIIAWKMEALYKYFIEEASSSFIPEVPSLQLSDTGAEITEDSNYYIAGPFQLTKSNISIKDLKVKLNNNVLSNNDYILTSSTDSNNNISNLNTLNTFYVKINKNKISTNSNISIEIDGSKKIKELTFMTNIQTMTDQNELDNNQPVVLVKEEEVPKNVTEDIDIEFQELIVEKIWEDNNNQDDKRPSSIKVQLYKNGTEYGNSITLNISNNWRKTWAKLLSGDVYTVKELDSSNNPVEKNGEYDENYTTTYAIVGNKTTITNTHNPETINVTGTKTWNDNNNQDGKRPESITINLLADGIEIREIGVSAEDNWRYSFTNLPKYENGNEIKYTISEDEVAGYETEVNGYNITNTYTPETIEKRVTKIWNDNNQTSKRAQYGLTLKANGVPCAEEVKLNSTQTSCSWENLPKYANGEEIVYTVEETTIPNEYFATYSEDTFTITNTYTPGKVNLKVAKIWVDQEDKDEIRPDSIEVQLYQNGTKYGDPAVLNQNNSWTHSWNGLDEKVNGENIIYSIEEIAVEGYTAEYSATNFENTNEIIITNTHVPAVITGRYDVVLRKVDESGNILLGSKFELSGQEYNLTTNGQVKVKEEQITSTNDIELMYILKETAVPSGYVGIEDTVINLKAEVERDGGNYKLTDAMLTDDEGNTITDENVSIKLEGQTIVIEVKNTPVERQFDLALRKFITKVNDIEYSREPVVDTSKLGTVVDGKTVTTAIYKHTKQPISVQKGDIVTYTIRVYNEGELDGYVDIITDYLPDNLLPILSSVDGIDIEKYEEEIKFNEDRLWQLIDDEKTVATTITSRSNSESGTYSVLTGLEDVTDTKLDAYVQGSDELDYIDVQIKCLVADTAVSYEYLTNIAEITDAQDINGKHWDGTDSELTNVNVSDIKDYKNEEALSSNENSYIPGQEDDDDFEKLVVKEFDLALRKFITKVNDVIHVRTPIVDASKLGAVENGKTITTATYTHTKQPVIVKTGDIVTYTIRIFNEGTISGFANEITDDMPKGLEFLPEDDLNKQYGWKMLDKDGNQTLDITEGVLLVTDYLSDADEENIIQAVKEENGVKTLDYKDVEIRFKVVAKAEKLQDNVIINEAQISADSDRDIDSIPNRDEKYDYTTGNNEDDIDYEPIKLQYFDLALRKFITKVNTTDYNNRYPEVIYGADGSITYNHTKDPVLVTTGDIVTYTIRVYNEGEIEGYATQIKDNLPEGLAFDPENETNKEYGWKMLDKDGNVTEDAEKVVAFSTDYLKNQLIEALVVENGAKVLSYKDVKIAFKVTEPNTSDRVLVNTAQILEDSDDDVDSVPGNDVLTEDDIDREYVRVQYFDLSLKKWVTKTQVTYNGKTTTTKTGFTEDSEDIAKVDLVAKQMTKTTVKFAYNIKITNEGELPGYATEIKDYIPKGLKFVAADNKDWKEIKDGVVVTDQLKDTLLNPGESATVEIVLTWKNSTTNTGLKTNYAEISADSAEDKDSIPDNYDFTEDDIDDAQVILSIKTAGPTTYIGLVLGTVAILAGGIFLIKKYVLD